MAARMLVQAVEAQSGEHHREDPQPEAPQPGGDQFHSLLQAMQGHMDMRFSEIEGRLNTRFDRVDTNIEELRMMMMSRFAMASGDRAPVQPPSCDPDPYAAGSSGFHPQHSDPGTQLVNFDDFEQSQMQSDQGTVVER